MNNHDKPYAINIRKSQHVFSPEPPAHYPKKTIHTGKTMQKNWFTLLEIQM